MMPSEPSEGDRCQRPDADPLAAHADSLRHRFVDAVLALQPESVFDFGCGRGQVLERLAKRGVHCVGHEVDPDAAAVAAERGVELCPPERCRDAAFDVAVLRHVLHHLSDPAATIAELCRIARRGVVVAEPWFDVAFPSQTTALDLDLWSKARDRESGRCHDPNYDAATLVEWLRAAGWDGDTSVEHYLPLRLRPLLEIEAELQRSVDGSRELLRAARANGVSRNGTVIVTVQR